MLTRFIQRSERMPLETDANQNGFVIWFTEDFQCIKEGIWSHVPASDEWTQWLPLAKDASPLIPTFGPHGRWPTEGDADESGYVLWCYVDICGKGTCLRNHWGGKRWSTNALNTLHFLPLSGLKLPQQSELEPAPQPDENGWYSWYEVKPTEDDANDVGQVLCRWSGTTGIRAGTVNWSFDATAKDACWQRCPNVGVQKTDVVPISVDELPCRVTTRDGTEWIASEETIDDNIVLLRRRKTQVAPVRMMVGKDGNFLNDAPHEYDVVKKGWSDA